MATTFLDNKILQGTGYVADAYARIVVDKDFEKAYNLALKAVAAFGGADVVKKMANDLETLKVKGELH